MTEIIDRINSIFSASPTCSGITIEGICKLVIKTDQVHPVRILDDKQVIPNDKVVGVVYHRLLNDAITDDLDYSYGPIVAKRHAQQIRTVVMVKRERGENWIDELINLIPRNLDMANFKLIDIGGIAKNTDQPIIYTTELGESGYEKHRMSYLIYALEYNIEYITC